VHKSAVCGSRHKAANCERQFLSDAAFFII